MFESVLIRVEEAACALAAMAAAAIASGAVELPDAGAAGTFAAAVVTGMATATGFGVVAVRAACWARTVRSTAEVSPPADLSVDFAGSAFGAPVDLAWDGWVAAVPVGPLLLALLSDGGPALALLFGSLLAAWLAAAFAAPALSAGGGALLLRRCGAGGGGGAVAVSAEVFCCTSPLKTSFAGGWSDRVDHCGAAWNAAFAAASEVTLHTGQASRNETGPGISKDRAIPGLKKYHYISMPYGGARPAGAIWRRSLFCPAARFAVCSAQKG
ncbi:MAG: hypothetical protein WB420_21190 [Bradyrhizobium sp.]